MFNLIKKQNITNTMCMKPHSIFFSKKVFYFIFFILIFIFSFNFFSSITYKKVCYADTIDNSKEIYIVYSNDGKVIFEGNKVIVGDKIIDGDLNEYEIYFVDESSQIAYAEFNGSYQKPIIKKQSKRLNFSNNLANKSVGLYLTHNDESYIPTDNTSSVYGKGGIHDVAISLANKFSDLNYNVYLDETLHLPHDSGAYGRSYNTANNLLNKNVDALFDIHRDGVARSVYVKNIDGVERCKVRIVVGQANPNKDANLQFAMYLVSVAKEYCPWLFLDIYYAKGHYNQALTSKGLLFEMGTYLAEKELVLETVPYLANVIDKTLFSTIVEDDNKLTITDTPTTEQQNNIVNNVLSLNTTSNNFLSKNINNVIIFTILFIGGMGIIIFIVYKIKNKKNYLKK